MSLTSGTVGGAPQFAVSPVNPRANQMVEVVATGLPPMESGVADLPTGVWGTIQDSVGKMERVRAATVFWDGERYRFRFAPSHAGEWIVNVNWSEGSLRSVPIKVKVKEGPPAFVRRREGQRYLALGLSEETTRSHSVPNHLSDSGTQLLTPRYASFFAIGLNLCWPDERGLESYRARFAKLKSVGGNFARIWTTQERLQETAKTGLGRYDAANGDFYDGIFRLADEYGIKLIFTIDDYRVLAKTDYFNAHWDKSPYNAANGGLLKEPLEFFHDQRATETYRKRLRYLVARYSAHPSLAAWEIWNEQDHIPKPGVPIEWFRETTSYLRRIDPYRHLITTSYSWDDRAEVWETPELDLVQRHMYGQGDTVDFVSEIQKNAEKLDRFGKPRMIGEFGITWKEPDIALDKGKQGTALHNALWASLMAGDAGGVLPWWWDNYIEPLDLWPVFSGFSKFVAKLDFERSDFQPVAVSVSGFDALAQQDRLTGDLIVWIHDPASNWSNDAKSVPVATHERLEIDLPITKNGQMEFWDTRRGQVVARQAIRGGVAPMRVRLPSFQRDLAIRYQISH